LTGTPAWVTPGGFSVGATPSEANGECAACDVVMRTVVVGVLRFTYNILFAYFAKDST